MAIESKGVQTGLSSTNGLKVSPHLDQKATTNPIVLTPGFVFRFAISGSLLGILLPLPAILSQPYDFHNTAYLLFAAIYAVIFLFVLGLNICAWSAGYQKRFDTFLEHTGSFRSNSWIMASLALVIFAMVFSLPVLGENVFPESPVALKEGANLAGLFLLIAILSLTARNSKIADAFFKWMGEERIVSSLSRKFAPVLFVLFILGAILQMTLVNTDPTAHDQDAYIQFTKTLESSHYTYLSDGNRTPLYPLFQTLFTDPDMSRAEAFTRGKISSLGLAILLTVGFFFMLKRSLPAFAVSLTLITAFTLVMFRAPYFQGELLYYFLFCITFILMIRMIHQPSWLLAGLTGLTAGLTHLTKASVTPALLAFGVFSVFSIFYRHWKGQAKTGIGESLSRLMQTGLVFVVFFIPLIPYMRFNQKVYGQSTYNVNSNFYLWYDSWEEAEQGTRAHGDRTGWPDMPQEELPSMTRYFQEHNLVDIASRLLLGTAKTIAIHCLDSYGYCKYELLFVLSGLLVIVTNKKLYLKMAVEHLPAVLFAAAIGIGYTLSFGWWAPIALGQRFMLVLFLPLMLCLAIINGNENARQQVFRIGNLNLAFPEFVNRIALLILIFDIPVLIYSASYLYSGS